MHKGRILRTGLCLALLSLPIQPTTSSAVSPTPSATCVSSTCTVTFAYTGDYYSWTVPTGVSNINFDVQGAQGGAGMLNSAAASTAGSGGRVVGVLTTIPGATLYFYVGGQGTAGTSSGAAGGFNGGGYGAYDTSSPTYAKGGAGGGGSDIRTSASGVSYTNRLVVAGGGGGGGGASGCAPNGGGGGGTTGIAGTLCYTASAGGGGTQSAGGTAYTSRGSTAGSFGIGGSAGNRNAYGSAGGGGGYYGGGAGSSTLDHGSGWSAGGGGGSSYTDPVLVTGTPTHTQNYRAGNGLITISYQDVKTATTTTLSLAGNVTSVEKRKAIDLTATVTVAGKVTFFSNGKRIAGCINKVAASTTAVCSVKATVMGRAIYTASFTPTSSSYLASTSSPLTVTVVRRTGTR